MSKESTGRRFVSTLERVLSDLDQSRVKRSIGDSTQNNRTISVNQLVRFLTRRGNRGDQILARRISTLLESVRDLVSLNRINRTDAVDVSEFLEVLNHLTSDSSHTRFLTRTLQKVS